MTVNILACPECKSLILPDTAQCPNCHFVFDEKRAKLFNEYFEKLKKNYQIHVNKDALKAAAS